MITVLIPNNGAWKRAPMTMPGPEQWVMILVNALPQIGIANPKEFAGWVILHTKPPKGRRRGINHFEVIAGFDDEVYWSPLPALDELKLQE